MARKMTGIRARHARSCPARGTVGAACRCTPSWEASVFSAREGKKLRKTFPTLFAAKSWRADASVALRKGELRTPSRVTLREAAKAWLEGARQGAIRTRSGDAYKPSAIRGYEEALRLRVLPELGGARLPEIRRTDLQDLADRLLAQGLDPSTIRNTLMPVRAIYRRAISRGDVTVNPTAGLELPAVRGRRDRIASPDEAARLLAALPVADRPIWATAINAGLRRGELRGLRWEDVDPSAGVIRVEHSYDQTDGIVAPKSRAGRRAVPIAAALGDELVEHKLRAGRHVGFAFGRSTDVPFEPVSVRSRAFGAWAMANRRAREADPEARPLEPIGLHECRHTFASLMIAAGVNAKALSTYMGHASITITLDRYGKLFPGNEEEAAGLLDAFLARADTAARLASVAPR